MVSQTELAWRLLQIIALALPAMGILLQVLSNLERDDTDSAPHHYLISSSMLFLVGPMAGAGLLSALIIATSYDALWLKASVGLISIPFIFLPIILYSVQRGTRIRFKEEFLPREKEVIEELTQEGEIPEKEAEKELEQIEAQRGSFLAKFKHTSRGVNRFFERHPLFSLAFHGAVLIWGMYLIVESWGIPLTISGAFLVLYSTLEVLSHFVKLPEE